MGIGGFGWTHVENLAILHERERLRLTAAADPVYERFDRSVDRLKTFGVRLFRSLEELLDSGMVDAVTCATPVPLHAPMALYCAAREVPFYMEKPPAVTIQDMDRIAEAVDRYEIPAAVGFQWVSMSSAQAVKDMIVNHRFGPVREVVAAGIWKRHESYYDRTSWAGQLVKDGKYVLDGTLLNPLSHVLHLALYFASSEPNETAKPLQVRGELYHVHRIPSEDTSCLEAELENGVRLLFFGTLCSPEEFPPEIIVDMERGTIRWRPGSTVTIIENGEERPLIYPMPDDQVHLSAFGSFADAVAGRGVVDCPPALCRSFVQLANGAFLSSGLPHDVSERHIRRVREEGSRTAELIGIRQSIRRGIHERKIFADLEMPWAVPGEWVDVSNLREFKLFEENEKKV